MISLLDHPSISGKYLFPQNRKLKRPFAVNSPLKSIGNILRQCLPQLKSLDHNYRKIAYRHDAMREWKAAKS